jgi:hypothetical protein
VSEKKKKEKTCTHEATIPCKGAFHFEFGKCIVKEKKKKKKLKKIFLKKKKKNL